MDAFLGMIMIWPMNWAPSGWALCQGQQLSISTYQALFALIGTTYGGNGQTTFQLPDLRGRAPIGYGQGTGLSNYVIGQPGGTEEVTLLSSNMPAHTHVIQAGQSSVTLQTGNGTGSTNNPAGNYLVNASDGIGDNYLNFAPASGAGTLSAVAGVQFSASGFQASVTGGSLPYSNLSPYLTLNYVIALTGIYPSRS